MRAGGGKQKGSAFEREVCKRLSLWLSNGTVEDCLWRSAMSGGRSTVAHAKGKRLADQAGDISAITPLGHTLTRVFMIECKSYRDLGFAGLPTGRGNLAKFWIEANLQAFRYGKLPMLIAKQNKYDPLILLDSLGVERLNVQKHVVLSLPLGNMHAVLFDVFLENATRPLRHRRALLTA